MIAFAFLVSLIIGLYIRQKIALCIILSLLWLWFIYKRTNKKITIICLCLIVIGFGVSFINIIYNNKDIYKGIVYKATDNYLLINSGGERLYVYQKNNPYNIGDIITIYGNKQPFSFTKIESSFDFGEYLKQKGVLSELSLKKIEVNYLTIIRTKDMRNAFFNHLDSSSKSLLKAILFSENDGSEINKDISLLHLNKLLSSSGIYLHFFLRIINFILGIKLKEKQTRLLSLLFLFPYLICTFPKFSVIKIVLLEILRWINKYILKDKFDYFTILSFSGFIFIILNYHLVYSDSFILGYLIPFISYFANTIVTKMKKWKRKLLTPLFVLGFFIIYEAKYYNSLNPLANIYSYILTPLFMLYSLIGLLCFYKLPLYGLVSKLTRLIGDIFIFLNKFSFNISCPKFNDYIAVILVLLLFIFMYYLSIGFKRIYQTISVFSFSIVLLNMLPINNLFTNEVSFINVGQGDSCLIRSRNKTVLIDTGGSLYTDIANDCLIPFFRKKRINNIDYVITTHDDYDHMGALTELRSNFKVKNYISSYESFPLKVGDIIFTNYNNHIESSNDDNENSLVIGFALMDLDFLIMGDAPILIEKKMMSEYKSIPCDILKVGHHGSDTSTSDAFISYLNPKEGIISVGKNYYGHPTKEVISILNKHNVKIKRTDKMGTITYKKIVNKKLKI